MRSHTIVLSIRCADGFTEEIALPGEGDLLHLLDVFEAALRLLPRISIGAQLGGVETIRADPTDPAARRSGAAPGPSRSLQARRVRRLH